MLLLRFRIILQCDREVWPLACSADGVRLFTLAVLTLACSPFAVSQVASTPSEGAADRSSGQAPATPQKRNALLNAIAGLGPSEKSQLSEKERFQLYLASTIGPFPILGEAAGAAVSQYTNTPSEWGQGWGAYGKRFGSNMAYNGIRQTLTYGISIPLHEDNRYFSSGKTSKAQRILYAMKSTFTAVKPDGAQTVSISAIAGVIGASAISSTWNPPSARGFGNVMGDAGISFATTAGFNVVREFLPDLVGKHRK